jgi:hypothetical protein
VLLTPINYVMSFCGNDGLSPCEKFYGKAASYWRILRVFRNVAIKVSRLCGLPKKLINIGNHCLFLGYADDRTQGTYRSMDFKINL